MALLAAAMPVAGQDPAGSAAVRSTAAVDAATAPGVAEARLIEIYRMVGRGQARAALDAAEALVRDLPTFHLAQLVYADLLTARQAPLPRFAAVPGAITAAGQDRLVQLHEEATRRLQALRERPPPGTVPRQFVALPPSTRHAIAVDASRSRLYLFENGRNGTRLVADYYVSVGKLGIDKQVEGDQRTPLGVYFITSRLDPRQLKDFYGAGALPINYPNEYDRRRGKTGHGIWLHGVPSETFVRSPWSTDGCVVMSNPDLEHLQRTVAPRSTPVVIAPHLDWVSPEVARAEARALRQTLEAWREAREQLDADRVLSFYSPNFQNGKAGLQAWRNTVERELARGRGRPAELKDLSILAWRDSVDIAVVTFGEVWSGERRGAVKRQYWGKEGGQWRIFYEGVIG